MDITRLHEFIIISREQSIKKAAEALQLAPTTLKSRLKTLETSLGIVLFEQKSGKLHLTHKGTLFYQYAADIVSEYFNLTNSLLSPEKYFFHHLRIAIIDGFFPDMLSHFFAILNKQNPDLRLELTKDSSCTIEEGLNSERFDLYFAPTMSFYSPEGITKYRFFPYQQFITLPAGHRLSGRESVSLTELDKETFILHPQTKESCVRDFQIKNLTQSRIRYFVYETGSSPVFNRQFVHIGKGLLMTPYPMAENSPDSVCLPLTDVPFPTSFSLLYRKDSSNPETVLFAEAFKQFIKENQSYENGKSL